MAFPLLCLAPWLCLLKPAPRLGKGVDQNTKMCFHHGIWVSHRMKGSVPKKKYLTNECCVETRWNLRVVNVYTASLVTYPIGLGRQRPSLIHRQGISTTSYLMWLMEKNWWTLFIVATQSHTMGLPVYNLTSQQRKPHLSPDGDSDLQNS